jgi:hypothetical protein
VVNEVADNAPTVVTTLKKYFSLTTPPFITLIEYLHVSINYNNNKKEIKEKIFNNQHKEDYLSC